MGSRGIIISVILLVVVVIGLSFIGRIAENVPADKITIMQDPVDGDLHIWTSPGLKYQNFGTTTSYSKSVQYWFSGMKDQGARADESLRIVFNDGGEATIGGSVRIELPLDNKSLEQLHTLYGSDHAIIQELVRPTYEKAVFMSGPLMSSKQSYADKKTQLIYYIVDQAKHGIYQTISEDIKGIDPITGKVKTITVVRISKNASGQPLRDAESPLKKFNIRTYNFSINNIGYDPKVKKQIENQQMAIMGVQQAIADAKKAEQNAITAEQEGKALAATAKWEREVEKAKNVVAAEERFQVSELDRRTAEQTKQQQILLGEGESTRKRLVMQADGALAKKLATYERVMIKFAEEFGKQKWVPEFQINNGNERSGSGNSVSQLMQLLSAQAARDLVLNMNLPKGK